MNIYLDVDGVLLINENNAAHYADEFLRAVLTKFPDTTYWLTTHNWKGENRAKAVLTPHLDSATAALLDKINPSEWGELKTDAINFSKDFLWFDDDLWPDELEVLEENNCTHRFVMVNLEKDPNQLKKLTVLIESIKK